MAKERHKGESLLRFPKDYTVLDLETTGVNPNVDKIIELSAIKYRDNQEVDRFSTLVNPRRWLSKEVQDITHIRPWDLKQAPTIDQVIGDFDKFLGNDTIVGYNVNFDVNFTYDAMEEHLGKIMDNNFVDVKRIAQRELTLDKYKQVDVVEHYGMLSEGAHRAINDCEMCNAIFQKLRMDAQRQGHMSDYEDNPRFTQMTFDDILKNEGNTQMPHVVKTPVKMVLNKDGSRVKILSSPVESLVGKDFKRSFGNHVFSKEELVSLAKGEDITIKNFKTKAGKVIDLTGNLAMKTTQSGQSFLGFNRTDLVRQRDGLSVMADNMSKDVQFQ